MPYVVYIMECDDGTLYTGITTDLPRRFKQHQDKKGGAYTATHKVKKIVYSEQFPNRSEALKREAEIKRWPRARKLQFVGK